MPVVETAEHLRDVVVEVLRRHYGLHAVDVTRLGGEVDENVAVTTPDGTRVVVKVAPAGTDVEHIRWQQELLRLAGADGALGDVRVPAVRPAVDGDTVVQVGRGGASRAVWVQSYVDGRTLAELTSHSPELLGELGATAADLVRALAFAPPAPVTASHHWHLLNAPEAVARGIGHVDDRNRRDDVRRILSWFTDALGTHLPALPTAVVHHDLNDFNVLARRRADGRHGVHAVLDFADALHTARVSELAIAVAYAMLRKPDPLRAAADVVRGYVTRLPLTDAELAVLYPMAAARLCVNAVTWTHRCAGEDHSYGRERMRHTWPTVARLARTPPELAEAMLAAAAGVAVPPGAGGAIPAARPRLTNPDADPDAAWTVERVLAARTAHFAPSQRWYYRRPMNLVRGQGSWLVDDHGRAYLDAVNNVAHVGHANPRVVRAASEQMGRLNTNSRFLYPGIARYAERLTALLPDPLDVVFLVCSGSEANDLAVRIARQVTGRRDMLVVDGAYHGNTTLLTGLSPDRYNGPGGTGPDPTTHAVERPDRYRGRYTYTDPDAGPRYAADVARQIARLDADGRRPAGFLAESAMGTAGSIFHPDGYLAAAFAAVRAAGGLCIADEVQVGFGRLGDVFWGFETQGVVPDIVTMGKPMGNGHPMAAVVTTRPIADAFDSGVKYFNTFGGNPVSCAIGEAVLDEIAERGLQRHAATTGRHFRTALTALAAEHPLVGDVRGRGMYLGVELVRDAETKEPAGAEALWISEFMKDEGVIVYPTGPAGNVLKIKPPLTFTPADADLFVTVLDEILRRDW